MVIVRIPDKLFDEVDRIDSIQFRASTTNQHKTFSATPMSTSQSPSPEARKAAFKAIRKEEFEHKIRLLVPEYEWANKAAARTLYDNAVAQRRMDANPSRNLSLYLLIPPIVEARGWKPKEERDDWEILAVWHEVFMMEDDAGAACIREWESMERARV